jgi:hypothetical protein
LRKARLANSISQGVRRNPPDGGTPQFLPHRFQISQFSGATLASLEMQLANLRIRRVQFSIEKAWRTSFQSEQAPAVLMLVSSGGGEIMTMHTMSPNENISWLA